jgi:hypothetical protein
MPGFLAKKFPAKLMLKQIPARIIDPVYICKIKRVSTIEEKKPKKSDDDTEEE